MTLTEAVESYLSLKRALGAVFSADARILHSFVRALGDVPLESISREACQAFCRGTGPPTRFWERKHYTLRGFFGYLVARGHLPRSPLPDAGPQIPRSFQAYIYSHDELRRILDATSVLETDRGKGQALTFRTILLVLYGAGLRPGFSRCGPRPPLIRAMRTSAPTEATRRPRSRPTKATRRPRSRPTKAARRSCR